MVRDEFAAKRTENNAHKKAGTRCLGPGGWFRSTGKNAHTCKKAEGRTCGEQM